MTWLATNPLGQALALVISVALSPVLFWPLLGIVQDGWQLPMLVRLRPRVSIPVIAALVLLLFVLTTWVLGPAHVEGRLLLAAVFGARPALWLTRLIVWQLTDRVLREDAADIRNELAGRLRERPVNANKSWPTFVFDLERARRRGEYEPPPI